VPEVSGKESSVSGRTDYEFLLLFSLRKSFFCSFGMESPPVVVAHNFSDVGAAMKEQIKISVTNYHSLLKSGFDDWASIERVAVGRYLACVPRDLEDEMRQLASGSGVSFETVLALNCRTELLAYGEVQALSECTTVVSGGFLAQNWDWKSAQRNAIAIVDVDAPRLVVTLTEGGLLCKMGMNDSGLSVALNLVRSVADGKSKEGGLALHLLLRLLLLRCNSTKEALELIRATKVDASSCFTILDRKGHLSVAEITPLGVFELENRADGLAAHTNHFIAAPQHQLKPKPSIWEDTVFRYDKALELLEKHRPNSVEAMRLLLSNHPDEKSLHCLCKHYDLPHEVGTLAVLVFAPSTGSCYICPARPCTSVPFERFDLFSNKNT
jgi:isopenicillin-N N-acyltransferase-like protein